MINPKLLLSELVQKLKTIPELDGIQIEAYDQQSVLQKTMEDAVAGFGYATGVLVAYESGEFPRQGETSGVRHSFTIGIISQDAATAFDIMTAIYNGTPSDGSARFIDCELEGCDPITDIQHTSSLDDNGNQLWSVRFTATEKQ